MHHAAGAESRVGRQPIGSKPKTVHLWQVEPSRAAHSAVWRHDTVIYHKRRFMHLLLRLLLWDGRRFQKGVQQCACEAFRRSPFWPQPRMHRCLTVYTFHLMRFLTRTNPSPCHKRGCACFLMAQLQPRSSGVLADAAGVRSQTLIQAY